MDNPAFNVLGASYPVAATTTPSTPFAFPVSGESSVRVANTTTSIAYLATGTTAANCAANSVTPVPNTAGTVYPAVMILPGTVESFSVPDVDYYSVWLASGTGTILLTPGTGS